MNERIFKLAGQAISEVPAPLDFHHEHFLFAEKFAELIVRECSQISKDYQRNYYESHGARIAKKIKKHFGVEE